MSGDDRQDDSDEVVQRVAFRLVQRRAGKPILRGLKLLALFLLALMAIGAVVLYWLRPFE